MALCCLAGGKRRPRGWGLGESAEPGSRARRWRVGNAGDPGPAEWEHESAACEAGSAWKGAVCLGLMPCDLWLIHAQGHPFESLS